MVFIHINHIELKKHLTDVYVRSNQLYSSNILYWYINMYVWCISQINPGFFSELSYILIKFLYMPWQSLLMYSFSFRIVFGFRNNCLINENATTCFKWLQKVIKTFFLANWRFGKEQDWIQNDFSDRPRNNFVCTWVNLIRLNFPDPVPTYGVDPRM